MRCGWHRAGKLVDDFVDVSWMFYDGRLFVAKERRRLCGHALQEAGTTLQPTATDRPLLASR
jgi:hypothetical protein